MEVGIAHRYRHKTFDSHGDRYVIIVVVVVVAK
jgi:hypothetical protein